MHEIAISTSDAASELWNVESEVCRCPNGAGSSIGDDVAENDAYPRVSSQAGVLVSPLLFAWLRSWRAGCLAPSGVILGHFVGYKDP